MTQIIIYQNDEAGVSIIYPIQEALDIYGIYAVARKDVPAGKPFKIIEITDLPLDGTFNDMGVPNIDRSFRDAWTVDAAELTDGIGSESNEFEVLQ